MLRGAELSMTTRQACLPHTHTHTLQQLRLYFSSKICKNQSQVHKLTVYLPLFFALFWQTLFPHPAFRLVTSVCSVEMC